jgi:hypothetical protein
MEQVIQQIRNSRASSSEASCRPTAYDRYPSRTVWLGTVPTVSYITVLLDSVKRDASARRWMSCVDCRHWSRHAEQRRASAPAASMLPFRLRTAVGPRSVRQRASTRRRVDVTGAEIYASKNRLRPLRRILV